MLKKILPYYMIPVSHAPFDTQVLSILWDHEETQAWIISHFLHIQIHKKKYIDNFFPKLMWRYCPFLNTYEIPYIIIKNTFNTFTDFLEQVLNDNFYVYTLINMKYIVEYKSNYNIDHNPLIIGIDSVARKVILVDFFAGVYKMNKCSYDAINDAYKYLNLCDNFNKDGNLNNFSRINLIHYKNYDYGFNKKNFKKEIIKYINGCNLFLENDCFDEEIKYNELDQYVFGIKCYDFAIQENYTIRILSMFRLHAIIWKKRIEFFEKNHVYIINKDITQNLFKLIELCTQNVYLALKDVIRDSSQYVNQIKYNINICKNIELKLCNFFLKETKT